MSHLSLAGLVAGCNAIVGIHEPLDSVPNDGGNVNGRIDARSDGPLVIPESGGASFNDAGRALHPWAEWPMPNPPSTGLPNPQTYDTSTDGVVVDTVTALAWQRGESDAPVTWSGAVDFCASLDTAGGGWRLPSRIELLSLIDFTQVDVLISPRAFPNTPTDTFWSSSPVIEDPSSAWAVHFGFSPLLTESSVVDTPHWARCVRVGPSPEAGAPASDPRYVIQSGTVLDAKTKLTWEQQAPASGFTFAAASDFCASLDLNGTGWRLPSVSELHTLVDEARSEPAADPVAFPDVPADYFWTSSRLPRFASYSWTIYFGTGLSTFFDASLERRVRCVR